MQTYSKLKSSKSIKTLLLLFLLNNSANAEMVVDTVWGVEKINNPIIEELIRINPIQRLKHIDQFGPTAYFGLTPYFSRYEHTIEVLILLQKANAPFAE